MSGMGIARSVTVEELREQSGPLIDVRSPSEFARGPWPGAWNLPLFDDDERASVGTAYKRQGRRRAVQLGLEITGPKLADLATKLDSVAGGAPPRIYCWRGGMRSASIAWLAEQIDLKPLLLKGGYKRYRHWVLEQFGRPWPLRLLGGRTGTGKTDLLLALEQRGVAMVLWCLK